jgi:chemotaxis protein methyltransferase CheR
MQSLNEKCFNDFVELIHELTGITVAKSRTSMVEGRLRRRIENLKLPDYEAYLKLVKEDKNEQRQFIDLVTTNETSFFRTPRIWEYIEKKILPSWLAAHPNQVFTAWSAAASSGEEAHTLGILCQEFKAWNPSFVYQIIGTDISNEMVELCQKGIYSGRTLATFKETRSGLFSKYMKENSDGSFQIKSEIKDRLRFHQHNLFQSSKTKDHFDLILIRNVLIYFKAPDQEKVLDLIASQLAQDGKLIIGESESLTHIQTPFKHVEALVYQLNPVQMTKSG